MPDGTARDARGTQDFPGIASAWRLRFALFAVAGFAFACQRTPQTSGAVAHDVYVWQRVWSADVRTSLEQARGSMQSFVVLAAEISVANPAPKIICPAPDYAALRATGKPVGLAIRIDPFFGAFRADDGAARAIVALARERLADARAHGVEPAELQIDFDCAESKLEGYRTWLRALREAAAPLAVCPTVLPSWLKRAEFSALARDCGRFVLQVHSVAPPRRIEDTRVLTDPARAVEWVAQAGRLGVPFRVALPTYTYLVAFDPEGKALGISAEGPSSRWPADARVVRWEADPADVAALVARWTKSRPAMMTGVIWYRLPVAGDVLNWRWPTLAAVLAGRAPASRLRLEASGAEPSEIVAINDGERDEPLPALVEAAWSGARLVAADALAGYTLEAGAPDAETRVVFHQTEEAARSRLPPGARRPIGWIRCDHPASISVSIPAPAAAPAAR